MRPRLDPEIGIIASAKKNDDLYMKGGKAPKTPNPSLGWRSKTTPRLPPRKTFKRLGLLLFVAIAAYVFIHNIPTDIGPQDRRRPVYVLPNQNPPRGGAPAKIPEVPTGDERMPYATRDYNGPLRFLELSGTLHAIGGTKGTSQFNKNVLFMASSLSSASTLLPIACEMGKELRSYVHFALISRSDIPIKQLREINGIDDSCQIIFHDARPDFSTTSTEQRFQKSVERALYHINNYMHPQAILVDESDAEEPSFLKTLRQQATKTNMPSSIIELPSHTEENLSWITKLDAASLLQWSRISVDILVHAHTGASGSLVRLLKSLSTADFTAGAVPHLTIELPEKIDPPTAQYLHDFRWPPRNAHSTTNPNQLTLRHRVSRSRLTEEESSVRFLEGFWPANPLYSHVLVLSPQAELSPNFFHYVKMAILEYRYSSQAIAQVWDQRLFGISLSLPSMDLSGTKHLKPPPKLPTKDSPSTETSTPFLWQAPNSNAAVLMGEKWVELHGFISKALEVQHSSNLPPALLTEKQVSKDHPAWMEHAVRLCRARGYWTLYPGAELATNLATIHTDLYRQPEEYENGGVAVKHGGGGGGDDDEIAIRPEPLLSSLPNNGLLLRFDEMSLLSWDGTQTSLDPFDEAALMYATEFRRTVGGCGSKTTVDATTLFCMVEEGI